MYLIKYLAKTMYFSVMSNKLLPYHKDLDKLVIRCCCMVWRPLRVPGVLLFKVAPGMQMLLHDRELPDQCDEFLVAFCGLCLHDVAGAC